MISRLGFYLWLAIGCLYLIAHAHSKDYAQSPLSDWYKSLRNPVTGISCCDISDCGPADEFETKDDGYRVKIEGAWYDVPKDKIVHNKGNPTGSSVVCYNKPSVKMGAPLMIYCFVAGALL